jgi:hypothetical protein
VGYIGDGLGTIGNHANLTSHDSTEENRHAVQYVIDLAEGHRFGAVGGKRITRRISSGLSDTRPHKFGAAEKN